MKDPKPARLADRPTQAIVAVVVKRGLSTRMYDVGLVYGDWTKRGAVPDEWVSVDRARWESGGNRWPPAEGAAVCYRPPVFQSLAKKAV